MDRSSSTPAPVGPPPWGSAVGARLLTASDDRDELIALPTAARTRWRVQGALVGLVLGLLVGAAPTAVLVVVVGAPGAALAGVGALAGVVLGIVWANRRHARFGYRLDEERLRVRDGVVVHSDAVAPLFRVQHVDLTRGPLQIAFGLATLAVHTASPAADVRLPDLRAEDAETIRDTILTSSKAAAAAVGTADADAV